MPPALLFVAALALAAPTQNIVQLAAGIPDLSTLVTALKAGNLVTALSGAGPFTVFAPTNEAFAALPPATLKSLLEPKNIQQLQSILEYHVISGAAVRAEDLKASQNVKTLEGQEVHINKISGSVTVQNAKVIQADVGATNGVVHVIHGVLTPPTAVGSVASVGGVYTFYKADGPDCAGAVVEKTNVLGNCTFSVAGIGENPCGGHVERLECDYYGNLLSYFYSPESCVDPISPAALAEQLWNCRAGISAADTRLLTSGQKGKCIKEQIYINGTNKEIYSKATWSCCAVKRDLCDPTDTHPGTKGCCAPLKCQGTKWPGVCG